MCISPGFVLIFKTNVQERSDFERMVDLVFFNVEDRKNTQSETKRKRVLAAKWSKLGRTVKLENLLACLPSINLSTLSAAGSYLPCKHCLGNSGICQKNKN